VGREVVTAEGEGKIVAINGAKKMASIRLKDGNMLEIPWDEIVEKEDNGN